MTEGTERVAIITVHGVADQRPGQTVRELARLLCHGGDTSPLYVEGEVHEVIVPVKRLPSIREAASNISELSVNGSTKKTESERRTRPGQASEFFLAESSSPAGEELLIDSDLGERLTDHLLWRYQPAERDSLYESTRISLRRQADGKPVDLYELYWADYSRLQPGSIRAVSALYQLFFHLNTLARDVVDQIALSTGRGGALRVLQWLHAWSAWLLKGPAALLQLTMLLLAVFGTAAFVSPERYRFLLGFGAGVAGVALAVLAMLASQRAEDAMTRTRAALVWGAGAVACAGIAAAAAVPIDFLGELYFGTSIALMTVAGVLLLKRYGDTVRGVYWFGVLAVGATALLLVFNAVQSREHVTTMYEWMLTATVNSGEYLLVALLGTWALLVIVQCAALLLGFWMAPTSEPDVAASLVTARIAMVISTALFAILSLLLWSAIAYASGLALKDLMFIPSLVGRGYRSAAIFFDAQMEDVGVLFTPLMGLLGVIGTITLIALAPSLREEITPSTEARDSTWAARLGRWWTAARRWLARLFGGFVPLLAFAGGVVYLLFVAQKLFGVEGALEWMGEMHGDVLVTIGKWLAGGAIAITALGARFTQTFGKVRVALDAALDVDNYFHDPADRRPPRARIFSRYASLLDYVRDLGYARVVIVAHSQGTVISADLLRYLHRTSRLRDLTSSTSLSLLTVGSPLRDLYAMRFPLLYRWMGAAPNTFANATPAASELGVVHWSNAYRTGDYVGRSIWTPADEDAMYRIATVSADGRVIASRAGDRAEFCLGAGAHTHYFSDDALALAVEIDWLTRGVTANPD